MTAEKRLDELEPVMGEIAAQLDLHTAQIRRVAAGIGSIVSAISEQSDNITFLLDGQADNKERLARIEAEQTQQGETLKAILSILQKRFDN